MDAELTAARDVYFSACLTLIAMAIYRLRCSKLAGNGEQRSSLWWGGAFGSAEEARHLVIVCRPPSVLTISNPSFVTNYYSVPTLPSRLLLHLTLQKHPQIIHSSRKSLPPFILHRFLKLYCCTTTLAVSRGHFAESSGALNRGKTAGPVQFHAPSLFIKSHS